MLFHGWLLCGIHVEDLVFVEMVHDVAVDYMLQYLTCDGGEGNRSIVGG